MAASEARYSDVILRLSRHGDIPLTAARHGPIAEGRGGRQCRETRSRRIRPARPAKAEAGFPSEPDRREARCKCIRVGEMEVDSAVSSRRPCSPPLPGLFVAASSTPSLAFTLSSSSPEQSVLSANIQDAYWCRWGRCG
jgi:hypothetical protein